MLGIAENVRKFLENSMKNWKLWLASTALDLCKIGVNRGIFQGDSPPHSAPLFGTNAFVNNERFLAGAISF